MSSVVIAIAVPLVLAALFVGVRSHARRVGDKRIVEYGVGLRVFAILLTSMAASIPLWSLFSSSGERAWLLGTAAIFALPAAFLLPHAYLTRFVYDSVGIRAQSPWREEVFVGWEQITYVRHSQGEASYVVVGPNRNELKLHAYMSGVPQLVSEMQRREIRGALLAQAIAK